MRKKQGYFKRDVVLEHEVEREVELPQGKAYVIYWIAVGVEVEPPGGDGINEPRYDASASVYQAQVVATKVWLGVGDEFKKYTGAFIGPIEEGLVRPGENLELSADEAKSLEGYGLEKAWVEPDEDDYTCREDR